MADVASGSREPYPGIEPFRLKKGKVAKAVRLVWPSFEVDAEAAKPLVGEGDSFLCVSDEVLQSFSELKSGNRYILQKQESVTPETKAGEEERAAAAANGATDSSRAAEDVPETLGSSKRPPLPAEVESVAKRQRVASASPFEEDLKRLLNNQWQQGEDLKQMKEKFRQQEEKFRQLEGKVSTMEKYQLAGTMPLAAAFSLSEFAVDTASARLRRKVAETCMEDRHLGPLARFRSWFEQGFVEDVDYCRVVLWEWESAGVSLAEFWMNSQGYTAQKQHCHSWYKPVGGFGKRNKHHMIPGDLLDLVRVVEQDLAVELRVGVRELQLFLGLYSTAVRHQRNSLAHYFSVYHSQSRSSRSDEGHSEPTTKKECRGRLRAAMEAPQKVLGLDFLRSRYMVIEQLLQDLDREEIEFFRDYNGVFRAFGHLLQSFYPAMVASSFRAEDCALEEFSCSVESSEEHREYLVVNKEGVGRFRYRLADRVRDGDDDREVDRGSDRESYGGSDPGSGSESDRESFREREWERLMADRERDRGAQGESEQESEQERDRGVQREFEQDSEQERNRGAQREFEQESEQERDRGAQREFEQESEQERDRGVQREFEQESDRVWEQDDGEEWTECPDAWKLLLGV